MNKEFLVVSRRPSEGAGVKERPCTKASRAQKEDDTRVRAEERGAFWYGGPVICIAVLLVHLSNAL